MHGVCDVAYVTLRMLHVAYVTWHMKHGVRAFYVAYVTRGLTPNPCRDPLQTEEVQYK